MGRLGWRGWLAALWCIGWLLGAGSAALAADGASDGSTQTAFSKRRTGSDVEFDVGWTDAVATPRAIAFALPTAAVADDKDEPAILPRREMLGYAVEQIEAYGRSVGRSRRVHLTATIVRGGIELEARGTASRARIRATIAEAEAVRDAAIETWLDEHAFVRLDDGQLSFDHARLAAEYADTVTPIARALRAEALDDRAFVELALSFVQAIPYEATTRLGGDPGYRRPLAVLARNRGDCDSKTVLFLALVRAELPAAPLAVVYVPGHALAGVGLDRAAGDERFREDGVRYLYAEPVGPLLLPLGGEVPRDHRARRGEVHPVAAAPAPVG
ncbi:MAG: hypothetical protein ABMB14_11910 [Myxococcota bacterium]